MTLRRLALFIDAAQPLTQASRLLHGLTRTGVHMGGMGKVFRGAAFIGTAALSVAAFAQNDPKVPVTFNQFVPAEVNGAGSVSQSKVGPPDFKSQVTYVFTISNNTTNSLNRSFFTASVFNATSTGPLSAPSIDVAIPVGGGTCDPVSNGVSVTCRFGTDGVLAPNASGKVYLVVNVPYEGQQLGVAWQGGGYEGNGNGDGCCQPRGTYLTSLSERTSDATYTTVLRSFLNNKGGKYFTGDKYLTKPDDQGTTYVNVPSVSSVYDSQNIDKYLVFLVETFVKPNKFASIGTLEARCAASRKFDFCFRTSLSIFDNQVIVQPDRVDEADNSYLYLPERLLDVIVRIDTSYIKNSTKIGDVIVKYEGRTDPVYACEYRIVTVENVPTTYLNGGPNNSKLPCYTNRFQYGPSTAGYTPALNKDFEWQLKNYKNGFLEFE